LESLWELTDDTTATSSADTGSPMLRQLFLGGQHQISETVNLTHNGLASPSSFYYNTVDGIPYTKSFRLQHRPESGRYLNLSGNIAYACKIVLAGY